MNRQSNMSRQAVTTLVTTRQLGFCAAEIYPQIVWEKKLQPLCDIYAFYRINLLLFETRMAMVQETFTSPNLRTDECYTFVLDAGFSSAACNVTTYPTIVGEFLSVLGPFSVGNEYFVPAFCQNRLIEGRFCPMSEQVTLSNLRQVVEALADEELSLPVRKAFYDHNPIPGAKWEGAPDNPVLLNPDEIMPADYTVNKLRNDKHAYVTMLSHMQMKLEKFVSRKIIDFKRKGSKSMLISNEQENLRCQDRGHDQALEDYYRQLILEGNVSEFWSSRDMNTSEQLMQGQVNLAGELPVMRSFIYPHYANRSKRCACWYYSGNYQTISTWIYSGKLLS